MSNYTWRSPETESAAAVCSTSLCHHSRTAGLQHLPRLATSHVVKALKICYFDYEQVLDESSIWAASAAPVESGKGRCCCCCLNRLEAARACHPAVLISAIFALACETTKVRTLFNSQGHVIPM